MSYLSQYTSNPYYQGYQGYYSQYSQYPQQQQVVQTPQQTPQQTVINGKIVDGLEMVKAQDVPFGSYFVCPKADMSVVYIKTWNNDGTTRIDEYCKIQSNAIEKQDGVLNDIYKAIDEVREYCDLLSSVDSTPTPKKKGGDSK